MIAHSLVAVHRGERQAACMLATDDGRFSAAGSLRYDAHGARYLHLRAGFAAPTAQEGFGFFHVVIDTEGALMQMAVGETDALATQRMLDRLRENDIDVDAGPAEALTAAASDVRRASMLSGADGLVSLRAKAYPSEEPDDESLLCLRLGLRPFGAVQLVISDTGRLLALATGRRDREAYQRVSHELVRKGFALEEANVMRSSS